MLVYSSGVSGGFHGFACRFSGDWPTHAAIPASVNGRLGMREAARAPFRHPLEKATPWAAGLKRGPFIDNPLPLVEQ